MKNNELVSIIIPVFNEERTIKEIIQKVQDLPFLKEIIVVDDGSTDETLLILRKLTEVNHINVIFHKKNIGKGAAIRSAIPKVRGDIIVIQDADLEYDPIEIPDLIKPIQTGYADVVYGSRLMGGKPQRAHMFLHKVGNRFLTLLTNIIYNTTLSDIETGYKAFKAEILKNIPLRSNDFTFEPEITAKVLRRKYRIYELPVSYYGRTYDEGKKITWKHGVSAIWALIKYRFID